MTDDDSIRLWSEVDDCSVCPFHETDYCHGSPDSRQPCRDAQFPHDATCDDAYEQESGRQFAYREECEREWQLDELAEKKKKEIQAKRRSTSRLNHKINQDIHRTRRKISQIDVTPDQYLMPLVSSQTKFWPVRYSYDSVLQRNRPLRCPVAKKLNFSRSYCTW